MGILSDVIATMRGGSADRAGSDLLAKVVQAVQATGKKGSVTVKIDVAMLKGGDTEMEIRTLFKPNIPVADMPMGIYYADDKGNLHRDNPKQLSMLGDDDKTIDLRARRMGVSGDDL